MSPSTSRQDRRQQLLSRVEGPVVLMAGDHLRSNADSEYPYLADSNFVFFFGRTEPGAAAWLDPANGEVVLFLPERTAARELWMGPELSFAEARQKYDVADVLPRANFAAEMKRRAAGRPVATVAVADPTTNAELNALVGAEWVLADPAARGDEALIDAIAALRLHKTEDELAEIRRAGAVTRRAVTAAMAATEVGGTEREIAALIRYHFLRHGGDVAFHPIVTTRGEVLHNHRHENPLRDGDLLLADCGAQIASGWCADVTRTWPVNGRFSPEQRAVYEIVLAARDAAFAKIRPGISWIEVHLESARVIAAGLVELGVLKGEPDGLVELGAHAPFFPHGLGHHLGLDPHDFECFGDRILYPGRPRSEQFGLSALRTGSTLAEGMVVTVEPGIYFCRPILERFTETFAHVLSFERAEEFLGANEGRGFGGIRIEDDVAVTADGFERLTPGLPDTPDEVEAAMASAGAATAR